MKRTKKRFSHMLRKFLGKLRQGDLMNTMDNYHDDESIPEGFREALGRNGKAVQYWCGLTPEKRREVLQRVEKLSDPGEIKSLVDELVGWEKGHPPYQL